MSAHHLEIEAGRFGKNRVSRSDGYCKCCLSVGTEVLGDEVHFVILCPQFQEDRKRLATKIANSSRTLHHLNARQVHVYHIPSKWQDNSNKKYD